MRASYGHKVESFDYYKQAINFFGPGIVISTRPIELNINKQHKNTGLKLPRSSKLLLELHYESTGQAMIDDDSQVHFNFYKKPPKYQMIRHDAHVGGINIPPHQSNHKSEIFLKIQETMSMVVIATHMHLRGKASSIFLIDPKGIKKRIFGLDPYILTFDRTYTLKKPLVIPKGSTIKCINWFDNSADNPMNPDPEQFVNYGETLTDEMSACAFKFLVPINATHTWSSIVERL